MMELSTLAMNDGGPWSGIWLQEHYWEGLSEVLSVMAPLLGGVVAAGVIGSICQTGPYFSWGAFQAGGLKALNPVKGAKKLFSLTSITKLLMTLWKIALIVVVVFLFWRIRWQTVTQLSEFDLGDSLAWIGRNLFLCVLAVIVLAIAIAAVDAVITLRRHERGLMMTKEEVKDEHKQYEMPAVVKKARFKKMRALSLARMIAEVPKATVIVTNPTRFAVALRYDPEKMDSPMVTVKGVRLRALRIRELAAEHGIPIVERPPLARTLYRTVPVGRTIPASLFEAVAEVLAYLHRLGHRLEGVTQDAA